MSAISQWLNGNRDFATGVKLYTENGGSLFYRRIFANAGPTDFNKNKLLAELEKMSASLPNQVSEKKQQPVKVSPSLQPTPDKKADNRKYLDLLKKKGNLYTQLNILIVEKRHLPAGTKLKQCAFDIITTHQQLTECWAMLDYFQEHQSFPAEKAKPEVDDKTRRQQLHVSISRAKTRLKNPNCRDRSKTELLLKTLEAERDELKAKPITE